MPTALVAIVLAAALAARGDVALRLERFDGPRRIVPSPRLGLPALDLPGAALPGVALDEGSGAGASRRARVDPPVALILGIIPGFGIGHLIAGSRDWVIWLIADIVIALVAWGPFVYWRNRPDYYVPFLSLLVIVERIFEGLSAYQAAGGGPIFRSQRWSSPGPSPADRALPVGLAARL